MHESTITMFNFMLSSCTPTLAHIDYALILTDVTMHAYTIPHDYDPCVRTAHTTICSCGHPYARTITLICVASHAEESINGCRWQLVLVLMEMGKSLMNDVIVNNAMKRTPGY